MTRTPSPRVEPIKSASDGKAKATTMSRSGRSPTERLASTGTAQVQLNAADPGPAINPVAPIAAAAPRQTKAALLRARLAAPGGVSLAELMHATGWQAHTLRAALTGLRKAGLTITRRREGTDTLYAIDAAGSARTLDDAPVAPEVASAVSPAATESKDGATEPSTTAPAESDA